MKKRTMTVRRQAVLVTGLISMFTTSTRAGEMSEDKTNVRATAEIIIEAPVDTVWKALAEEFDSIEKWASGVNKSDAIAGKIGGSKVAGRACKINVPGFSDTQEQILTYDTSNYLLRYALADGLPGFVKKAENEWRLYDLGNGETKVEAETEMYASGLLGFLFRGLMKSNTAKVLNNMQEEIKYFIETGEPHPRKKKAMGKYKRKKARKKG